MTQYLYIHGFCSSSQSKKAQFFKNKFKELNIDLNIPDLNLGDFSNITLTKQLEYLSNIINKNDDEVIIIGSSLGGYLATIMANKFSKITKLICLASAFKFIENFDSQISNYLPMWESKKKLEFFHYGYNKKTDLNYDFYLDLVNYRKLNTNIQIPSLIIHGIQDETIPIKYAREYNLANIKSILVEINDDHSLVLNLDYIWDRIKEFIFLIN